jgi:uncharacterized protein DUF6544
MESLEISTAETQALLAQLRTFCFPGGEQAARQMRFIKTTQRGELRAAPGARWMPFTAGEVFETTRSSFRWDARLGGGRLGWIGVTDAYEGGHGRLVIKLGGIVPVKKIVGPDVDTGELQRYLSLLMAYSPAILNHASLEWKAPAARALRVRDVNDPTNATVELHFGPDGRPLSCHADRPRLVGKQSIPTPWCGTCVEFREWEGVNVASRVDATWHLADGPFTYYRSEITSFTVLR